MGNLGEELSAVVEKGMIGEALTNGALILKAEHQYENQYLVLAYWGENRLHPFVVWNANTNAEGKLDASKGDYAESVDEARICFKKRSYK